MTEIKIQVTKVSLLMTLCTVVCTAAFPVQVDMKVKTVVVWDDMLCALVSRRQRQRVSLKRH
jgi:hypothetical protein